MNELRVFNADVIPVYVTDTGEKVVYGRELQDRLCIKGDYTSWMKEMIAYGFTYHSDYDEFWQKGSDMIFEDAHFKSPNQATALGYSKNHLLKFDMAKHIAMIQRTPEGKAVRQKLIDLEEKQSDAKNSQIGVEQILANPDFGIQVLVALKEEREKSKGLVQVIEAKDTRIMEMRPKEIFADSVSVSDSLILVRDLAKLIKQNGVDIGERRLYDWMRDHGYITKQSKPPKPTQKAMELGLFKVVERTVVDGNGKNRSVFTTMVTGKGQLYFINKLVNKDDGQLSFG